MRAGLGTERLMAQALALVAFALRTFHLGEQSLWYDEAHSLLLSQRSLPSIIQATARDTMPPLHYLLLHFWGLAGGGDFYMRFPSALSSALCAPLVYLIGRRLFSAKVGVAAAGITALSPFQVYFGQEARMYSLLGALSLLCAVSLIKAGEGARSAKGWWAVYAASGAMVLYTHGLAGLTVLSLALAAALYFSRTPGYSKRLALWSAVALGLFAPWGLVLAQQSARVLGSFWVSSPTVVSPLASLYVFLYGGSLPAWLLPLGIFLPLAAVAVPFYGAIRRKGMRGILRDNRSELFVGVWLVVPLIGLYILSLIQPVYLERVVIGASFPWYIALALVLSKAFGTRSPDLITGSKGESRDTPARFNRWATGAVGVALGGLALVGLSNWYFQHGYSKPPLREAAEYIRDNWESSDIVLHTSDGSFLPFQLYAPWTANHLLYGDPELFDWTARARSTYGALEYIPTRLEELPLGGGRLWLVVALDHSREFQVKAAREIDRALQLREAREFRGIFVRLYGQVNESRN